MPEERKKVNSGKNVGIVIVGGPDDARVRVYATVGGMKSSPDRVYTTKGHSTLDYKHGDSFVTESDIGRDSLQQLETKMLMVALRDTLEDGEVFKAPYHPKDKKPYLFRLLSEKERAPGERAKLSPKKVALAKAKRKAAKKARKKNK